MTKKQLDWAIQWINWGVDEFISIIWSEEFAVEISQDLRQIWVFREPNEKWLANCIHPKSKYQCISLMI
jgi:hypothetical protein